MIDDDRLAQQHAAIWAAIDDVAAHADKSASRLSILSGQDSTALNKSKRRLGEALRFPTMETIARILDVAGMTYAQFGILVDKRMGRNVA